MSQEIEEEGEGDEAATHLEREEAAGDGDDVYPSPGLSFKVSPPFLHISARWRCLDQQQLE